MNPRNWLCLAVVVLICGSGSFIVAQNSNQVNPGNTNTPAEPATPTGSNTPDGKAGDKKAKQPESPPLPNDKRLLALHLEFVKKAEKLAAEYEHNKQPDKAAAVYGEILKLVPAYPKARQMVEAYQAKENTADRVSIEVKANDDWQDTGVRLIAGKPFHIKATGNWTINMAHVVTADGMEIPKELRSFKLGSLIGVIGGGDPKKARPFAIGSELRQVADQSGPLLVRMHDSDISDNAGKLKLEIVGRFDKK